MKFKPTEAQDNAIKANGNILVAAAAGSGKTAVLVERVIEKLCSEENPVSADKMLIVTFTNAAADEMRLRIEKRLDEKIIESGNKSELVMQKRLLTNAKICTIDSFCIDFVRDNFELAGVSPDFKIVPEEELDEINNRVLANIVGKYFNDNNPQFYSLLDLIGAEFDEKNFMDFVFDIYKFSRQLPFPKIWFESLCQSYKLFDKDNIWYKFAFERASKILDKSIYSLKNAEDLMLDENVISLFEPVLSNAITGFEKIKAAVKTNDWDSFFGILNKTNFDKVPSLRSVPKNQEAVMIRDIYSSVCSNNLNELFKLFYSDESEINGQFKFIYPSVKMLSDILIEYEEKLFSEYSAENVFTFHNTEHLALNLLCDYDGEKINIKPIAEELSNTFEEIMVDEYQDTNDLQDMIFGILAGKSDRIFVVGDLKQSIYSFRGANPNIFLAKKNSYLPYDKNRNGGKQKIILANNFRSKDEICYFINFLFENLMTEKTGAIIYDDEEKLIPAANFPKTDFTACEINIVSSVTEDKDAIVEARNIAQFIFSTIKKDKSVMADKDTLRKAKFSDFAILFRSITDKAVAICDELKKCGIPVSFSSEEFADTIEISTVLSLLKVIDNPQSDVELLCVMLSPIFSFTVDEMAQIRAGFKDGNLYQAVINAAEKGNEKVISFLKKIDDYRLLSILKPIPEFLTELLRQTNYLDIVTSFDNGIKRRSNLLRLCNIASSYVNSNTYSINGFIKYINSQSKQFSKSSLRGGDTVKIMSIHASKGLQFPFCILASASTKFNDNELKQNVIYRTDLGLGFRYFDEENKERVDTVSREAIINKINSDRVAEELRLLYVALTRAEDKLLISGTVSNPESKISKLKTLLYTNNGEIDSLMLESVNNVFDWILLAVIMHPDFRKHLDDVSFPFINETNSKFDFKIINSVDLDSFKIESEVSAECQSDFYEKIKSNAEYEYPYSDVLDIDTKASVTELTHNSFDSVVSFSNKPMFMENGVLTATERGTAMHKVIQFFDFKRYNSIDDEIERLYEFEFITEEEAKSINKNALKIFFESDLFKRIMTSEKVNREMRFMTELPAKVLKPDLDKRFDDEKIVVQGAVDLCFIEDGKVVILDFKTDRVDDINELKIRYQDQLDIYAFACEKIFCLPVKEKIIYSFNKSEQIIL